MPIILNGSSPTFLKDLLHALNYRFTWNNINTDVFIKRNLNISQANYTSCKPTEWLRNTMVTPFNFGELSQHNFTKLLGFHQEALGINAVGVNAFEDRTSHIHNPIDCIVYNAEDLHQHVLNVLLRLPPTDFSKLTFYSKPNASMLFLESDLRGFISQMGYANHYQSPEIPFEFPNELIVGDDLFIGSPNIKLTKPMDVLPFTQLKLHRYTYQHIYYQYPRGVGRTGNQFLHEIASRATCQSLKVL
jgi:hypothetical protein